LFFFTFFFFFSFFFFSFFFFLSVYFPLAPGVSLRWRAFPVL